MAQNHYVSKTKRRPKNGKRKDVSAETMAAFESAKRPRKNSFLSDVWLGGRSWPDASLAPFEGNSAVLFSGQFD